MLVKTIENRFSQQGAFGQEFDGRFKITELICVWVEFKPKSWLFHSAVPVFLRK
jgi:hypothetical protein